MGEGDLPHQLCQGVLGLVAESLDVSQVSLDVPTIALVLLGQVLHPAFVFDVDLILLAAGVNAELSL